VLHRPVETTALTGQVPDRRFHLSDYPTYQEPDDFVPQNSGKTPAP